MRTRLRPFLVALVALAALAVAACSDDSGSSADGRADTVVTHDGPRERGAADGAGDAAADADGAAVDSARGDSAADGPSAPHVVSATTLAGKVMFGYQGWFACPGDGSLDAWRHWFSGQDPSADKATFDLWPDLSELGAGERCATSMQQRGGGGAAYLFSSARRATVMRHFAWMADHDLDGVFLQRFISELGDPKARAFRDTVTSHVRAGAETHKRVFALMYDISGAQASGMLAALQADWTHVVDDLKVTQSPRYLHHNGRPVLGLWGLGFSSRAGTASEAKAIIDWFKSGAPSRLRVTLVGGVPHHWRTLDGDSRSDAAWSAVYRSYDVVSPWSVGAFVDDAGADVFRKDRVVPDLAALGAGAYMPVVFPGFSWSNLKPGSPLNQIPRRGGTFYWRQVYNVISAGAKMIYVAMFDEVDEGTAMFKAAPSAAQLPTTGSFLTLDADGQSLPSDFYLKLGRATGRALRGEIPATTTLPSLP